MTHIFNHDDNIYLVIGYTRLRKQKKEHPRRRDIPFVKANSQISAC